MKLSAALGLALSVSALGAFAAYSSHRQKAYATNFITTPARAAPISGPAIGIGA